MCVKVRTVRTAYILFTRTCNNCECWFPVTKINRQTGEITTIEDRSSDVYLLITSGF